MFRSFKFSLLLLSLIVTSSHQLSADVVSLESNYVAGQTDIVDKLNNDRTALTNGVNNIRGVYAGSVQSSGQIKADTVGEENMADDVNSRIRTAEGASCPDFVYSGLIPTTSASLIGSIDAGVAYPDGYRIEKTSSTSKTFEANKWTWGYLLTSGSFSYQVDTIGATTPTAPANSALLFKVSTDATTINTVSDLRKTSCTAGPFSAISDAAGEASLGDILSKGSPVKSTGSEGFSQGLFVSYETNTTFKVTKGSAYINGKYRFISQDVSVPQTADAPSSGTSGIDTGAIAGSTRYNVFAVADQDALPSLSISYSTSTAPTGVTNYRKIGEIKTDAGTGFESRDVVLVNGVSERELTSAWIRFRGIGTVAILNSQNVSSITDGGTGLYTVTFDQDFVSSDYTVAGSVKRNAGDGGYWSINNAAEPARGSVQVETMDNNGNANEDMTYVNLIAIGDLRR